jgi:hypothetical protein
MGLELDKPWRPCTDFDALPGHMGVYELGNDAGAVIFIGYAGGRSRFGLRGEIEAAAERVGDAAGFRYEVTTAYLTRYQELLMAHQATSGALPAGNGAVHGLGRLSPGQR